MLPKKNLLAKNLIEKVLRQGKSIRGRNISLKYLVIPGKPAAFAFIISSKVAKRAVDRNKLKRRGRAIVFKLLPQIKEGCLSLIFFEKGSIKMSFPELMAEMTQLFKKVAF
jgi:ribonuclease P protein component